MPDEENSKDDDQIRKTDRYICNFEQGIVLKRKTALEILDRLKIKPYETGNDKNIHYSDVFRCLVKRVLIERGIEYKLGQQLNRKIKGYWSAKFRDVKKDKRGTVTV